MGVVHLPVSGNCGVLALCSCGCCCCCCCSFLDTYFEADLKAGRITEPEVQELIDQFVMKMRIVR
jgi:hypothetical protein